MKTKKGIIGYRIKWFWNILRHGLFLHGVTNRLSRIGIEILPYYWVQEETEPLEPPKIKDHSTNDYLVSDFGEADLLQVRDKERGIYFDQLVKILEKGNIGLCVRKDDEIAAFMFIELNDFLFKGRKITLKSNEAYLTHMYTFEDFRGKNIAPYLRYSSYEVLRQRGVTNKYSISDYFNKSTHKFKKKLNSKPVNLFLNITLFKKKSWNFKLKDYS